LLDTGNISFKNRKVVDYSNTCRNWYKWLQNCLSICLMTLSLWLSMNVESLKRDGQQFHQYQQNLLLVKKMQEVEPLSF
jgi:hypothetical protein